MKQSEYNYFYSTADGFLAFNARTDALACLSEYEVNKLRKIIHKEEQEDIKLIDELKLGGFLVEDHVNELDIIRHDMYTARFASNQLTLTIAPTMDCNFRCPYCYEKDVLQLKSMSDEVADKIVDYVRNRSKGLTHFHASWYGGEPLLEYNRILELSKKFIKICEENDVEYSSSMVTNGYLLTKERLIQLIESKVYMIQITLDGIKSSHDSRRYLKNHGATFDKIISNLYSYENIFKEYKEFQPIAVRMNVDRSNKKEAFELLEILSKKPLGSYVVPYIAGVYISSDVNYEKTLTNSEYSVMRSEFNDKCKTLGFDVNYLADYPQRINSSCCCDRLDTAVIDAEGNLYKCWEEIGDSNACVGQIGMEETYNLPNSYYNYLLFDPTISAKCKNCRILPVCMGGGCPIRRDRDKRVDCRYFIDEFQKRIRRSALAFGKEIREEITL